MTLLCGLQVVGLILKCLGELSFGQDDGDILNLKLRKGAALLCYLAVTSKKYSRSALAGLFWTDMPETNQRMNLRKLLNRLKPFSTYLLVTRETLSINAHACYRVDVNEFETAARNLSDIEHLEEAVRIYQGEFLEGFESDDFPLFYEWVLFQRARLRSTYLLCLQVLIKYYAEAHNHLEAIYYARLLLTSEPWHEEVHQSLIRLLALSGQRSAALKQYEACQKLLSAEFGLEPAQ